MIRTYGSPDSMPKKKENGKVKKIEFVVALVDILRTKYGNDYEKVANLLRETAPSKNKGFGGKWNLRNNYLDRALSEIEVFFSALNSVDVNT